LRYGTNEESKKKSSRDATPVSRVVYLMTTTAKSVTFALLFFILSASRFFTFSDHVSAPEVFAPGIVSTGKEFGLTFMPNGKEAYFTRFDAEKKTNHIYGTVFANGAWQTPVPIEFSADAWRDLDPSVAPDGKRLFFVSTRPKPGADPTVPSKDMDIWVSIRDGQRWGAPQWLENVNSDAKEGSPSVARDGTLYFFSDRNAAANTNSIYSARLVNGKYGNPEKLPAEVNAGPSDTSPFIASDGKTLLFYSNRPGGYGKGDLYVSFMKDGHWTQAINLGPNVNTQESEYNPSVSPDGEQFYFGRKANIYVTPTSAVGLDSLKPKLFR
jgi:Tol biopolymer transport system component